MIRTRPDDEPMRLAGLRAATRLTLPDCCALEPALAAQSTLATVDAPSRTATCERHVALAPVQEPVE